ncbi:hypothetical protein LINPERPRIM_LOCUS24841 [Linum perenne]
MEKGMSLISAGLRCDLIPPLGTSDELLCSNTCSALTGGTRVATPLRSGLSMIILYTDHLIPGSSYISILV